MTGMSPSWRSRRTEHDGTCCIQVCLDKARMVFFFMKLGWLNSKRQAQTAGPTALADKVDSRTPVTQ